jgi:TolA-binding protein
MSHRVLSEAHYWLGVCYHETGKNEMSKSNFDEAIRFADDPSVQIKLKEQIIHYQSDK